MLDKDVEDLLDTVKSVLQNINFLGQEKGNLEYQKINWMN